MFAATTIIIVSLSVFARLFPNTDAGVTASKHVTTVDIFVIATLATTWTALLTVALGCVIVNIMKGPAYVADSYPLVSKESPAPDNTQH